MPPQHQVAPPPQHEIPVQQRHQVGFHEVHGEPLFALVEGEGFQGLSSVVKFCQNHTVVASHQGTRSVAIVLKVHMKLSWK